MTPDFREEAEKYLEQLRARRAQAQFGINDAHISQAFQEGAQAGYAKCAAEHSADKVSKYMAEAEHFESLYKSAHGQCAKLLTERDQLKAELEAVKAGHERYRELTRSNLAEQEWKKDNDRLRAENAKLKSMLREVAFSGTSEWTEHPAISYHEIQVEKSWIKEAQALLSGNGQQDGEDGEKK